MSPLAIDRWLLPPKLRCFRRLRRTRFNLLDVGCGNHSPSLVKHWFPRCEYFGLDRESYNNDAADDACVDHFFQLDLTNSDLAGIPDNKFDVVICAHVIEHLTNGLEVIQRLAQKLAPRGEMYLEFPSVRSLSLPSARGTLNFCDDRTHVRCYTVPEVCNALLNAGTVIRRAGRRRSWPHLLLTPLAVPASWARRGAVMGGRLWDFYGFADYVWAARPGGDPSRPGGSAGARGDL